MAERMMTQDRQASMTESWSMCCACHRADVQMSPLVLGSAHLWQMDPGSLQSGLAATVQTLRLQHAAMQGARHATTPAGLPYP